MCKFYFTNQNEVKNEKKPMKSWTWQELESNLVDSGCLRIDRNHTGALVFIPIKLNFKLSSSILSFGCLCPDVTYFNGKVQMPQNGLIGRLEE